MGWTVHIKNLDAAFESIQSAQDVHGCNLLQDPSRILNKTLEQIDICQY